MKWGFQGLWQRYFHQTDPQSDSTRLGVNVLLFIFPFRSLILLYFFTFHPNYSQQMTLPSRGGVCSRFLPTWFSFTLIVQKNIKDHILSMPVVAIYILRLKEYRNAIWSLDVSFLHCRETKTTRFPAGLSFTSSLFISLSTVFRQVVVSFPVFSLCAKHFDSSLAVI